LEAELFSSILGDPGFLPEFSKEWAALLEARNPALPASVWWYAEAKPFFRNFCQHFSKVRAHRLRETRHRLQKTLALALVGGGVGQVKRVEG
jgi:hypothetical protein